MRYVIRKDIVYTKKDWCTLFIYVYGIFNCLLASRGLGLRRSRLLGSSGGSSGGGSGLGSQTGLLGLLVIALIVALLVIGTGGNRRQQVGLGIRRHTLLGDTHEAAAHGTRTGHVHAGLVELPRDTEVALAGNPDARRLQNGRHLRATLQVRQGRLALNQLILSIIQLNLERAQLLDTVDQLAVVLHGNGLSGRVFLGRILGELHRARKALLNDLAALALLVQPLVGVGNRLRDDKLVNLLEHVKVRLHLGVGLVALQVELDLELLVAIVVLEVKRNRHTRSLDANALIPVVVNVNG